MDLKETGLFQKIKIYNKVILVFIFSIILYIFSGIYNEVFLNVMTLRSYLTWHTIFEFASILVSFSVFTVAYFIYEESKNLRLIMFGCLFLLMGGLDLFHTLSYEGMPDFFIVNDSANRATTLWILSRFLGSLGFMFTISIPINRTSNIKKEFLSTVTTIFAITLFFIVTYYPNFFPPMYLEYEGLTDIKIFMEYIIILILVVSFILIAKSYKRTNSNIEYKFMIALVLLIFSEFSFTSYGNIYDVFNYIGHLYKVIAFSILYKAIYIENISTPYRDLEEAKNKLKRYSDNLNLIVRQRTQELEELNGELLNDLEYAKEMQRCLLPQKFPNNMFISFDAEYLPAENLSGDFYNVVKLDEENIAIYIGDVSGHGISAAMLTVFAYQNVIQLREKAGSGEEIIEPGFVLKNIYKSFNKTNISEEKYIVMLYGIYNILDRTFNYASAGINVSPCIIKKSGEIEEINSRGFPICKLADVISPYYDNRNIQLEKGDKLFFYSDGLVEARNKNGEICGQDKLKSFLKNNHTLDADQLNSAIKNEFFKHIGYDSDLMDDVTFLTMHIIG